MPALPLKVSFPIAFHFRNIGFGINSTYPGVSYWPPTLTAADGWLKACIVLAFTASNTLLRVADGVFYLVFSNEANVLLSFAANAEVGCMIDALICMDRIHA